MFVISWLEDAKEYDGKCVSKDCETLEEVAMVVEGLVYRARRGNRHISDIDIIEKEGGEGNGCVREN